MRCLIIALMIAAVTAADGGPHPGAALGASASRLYADAGALNRKAIVTLRAGSSSTPQTLSPLVNHIENSAPPPKARRHSVKSIVIKNVMAGWGILQVVFILANAIRRVLPVALQPLIQNDMMPAQWAMYVAWSLYMGYAEGYQAFQLKFSPLVVKRAFGLSEHSASLPMRILSFILAGPYAMGLFGATKKRMIVSWSITAGVFGIISVIKKLPYPYRSIVDAGVVVGLTYGTLSILWLAARGMLGYEPDVDPCLPAPAKVE